MLEAHLRTFYQPVMTAPFIKKIANYIEPEQLTYAGCFFGIAVIPALIFHAPLLAISLLLLSGCLDMLDGAVARAAKKQSTRGAVLDIVSDRIVEWSVMAGLILCDPGTRAIYGFIMLGSCYICITSFLVVGIFTPNQDQKGFYYSPGLMERAEAFIFFILMIGMPRLFPLLAILFSALVLYTAYVRVHEFVQQH